MNLYEDIYHAEICADSEFEVKIIFLPWHLSETPVWKICVGELEKF